MSETVYSSWPGTPEPCSADSDALWLPVCTEIMTASWHNIFMHFYLLDRMQKQTDRERMWTKRRKQVAVPATLCTTHITTNDLSSFIIQQTPETVVQQNSMLMVLHSRPRSPNLSQSRASMWLPISCISALQFISTHFSLTVVTCKMCANYNQKIVLRTTVGNQYLCRILSCICSNLSSQHSETLNSFPSITTKKLVSKLNYNTLLSPAPTFNEFKNNKEVCSMRHCKHTSSSVIKTSLN